MKVIHRAPLLGGMLKKQDAISVELSGLIGAHPSTPDRILAILNSMENDLAKDKTLSPKIKKELKANIEKQKDLIKDIKQDEPKIAKNRNEYIEMLTATGIKVGNSEDFMEKRFTDPEQLRKFYKDRKIRKEAAIKESIEFDLLDPDIEEFII